MTEKENVDTILACEKPSQMLELAFCDAKALKAIGESWPSSNVWYEYLPHSYENSIWNEYSIPDAKQKKCIMCFAGSIIALKFPPEEETLRGAFSLEQVVDKINFSGFFPLGYYAKNALRNRLFSLDAFRRGDYFDFLKVYPASTEKALSELDSYANHLTGMHADAEEAIGHDPGEFVGWEMYDNFLDHVKKCIIYLKQCDL